MYYQICEGKLTITNTGNAAFTVSIVCDEETDPSDPGWLNVIPRSKEITPGKCCTFSVRYYPGLTGPFSTKFQIGVIRIFYFVLRVI